MYSKLTEPQMFSVSVPRTLKIARRASVVESFFNKLLFSKVKGEISAFYNSVENFIKCIDMSRIVALLEMLGNFLSNQSCRLTVDRLQAYQKETPNQTSLRYFENFESFPEKMSVMEFFFSKLQANKL